jgi:23S rRNA pseudouridine2605 synthase
VGSRRLSARGGQAGSAKAGKGRYGHTQAPPAEATKRFTSKDERDAHYREQAKLQAIKAKQTKLTKAAAALNDDDEDAMAPPVFKGKKQGKRPDFNALFKPRGASKPTTASATEPKAKPPETKSDVINQLEAFAKRFAKQTLVQPVARPAATPSTAMAPASGASAQPKAPRLATPVAIRRKSKSTPLLATTASGRVRLNRYLALQTGCSRREADAWICQGRIKLNGTVAKLGKWLHEPDKVTITLDDEPIVLKHKDPQVILLYKGSGAISTRNDDLGRKTLFDRLPPWMRLLKSVGRLDRNSTGLLLLTNDGDLHYRLTHASYHVSKVYEVTLDRNVADPKAMANQLLEGVTLQPEDTLAKADQVALLAPDRMELTLTTGYNRQVRRMFEALGYDVVYLKRIAFGPLVLHGMKVGQWRALDAAEAKPLYEAVGLPAPTKLRQ